MQNPLKVRGASATSRIISSGIASTIKVALILSLALGSCLFCSETALAIPQGPTPSIVTNSPIGSPIIAINPKVGPPTASVLVSGNGFDPHVRVNIYFDTTYLATTTTNGVGAFGGGTPYGGVSIQVPASAVPGDHWISAIASLGYKAAQKFLVRTDWTQFHFDSAKTGFNPYENVVTGGTNLVLRWSFSTGGSIPGSPAVAGGIVYTASEDGTVYALNATTGALVWRYTTGGAIVSSPAVSNGLVLVGSEDGTVYALNAATGARTWRFTTGGPVLSSPAVGNGVVYIGSNDGNVYAFAASTGRVLWNTSVGQVTTAPALAGGILYVVNGGIVALDAQTGVVLWGAGAETPIVCSPAAAYGMVYVASEGGGVSGNMYALDGQSGNQVWEYDTPGFGPSSPAVAQQTVYIGSAYDNMTENGILVFDAMAGTYLGQSLLGNSPVISAPSLANNVLYYAYQNTVYGGSWQYTTGGLIESSPVVVNAMVYVTSDDGTLYAFGLPRHDESK